MMNRIALTALAVAILAPAIGFAQVVLPPGQVPMTGLYPGNIFPSGQVNVPGQVGQYPGQIGGQVGGYPGQIGGYPGQGGVVPGTNPGLYNPYDDPRYARQYGNRYQDQYQLNGGLSTAIVPALMGGVVGAVLGAHFGLKGIMLGGIAGFLIGNAVWQHFTGRSVFDFLYYGPWSSPYGGGYGGGYPGAGGYPGGGYPPTGYPGYQNPFYGGGYNTPSGNVFGGTANRITIGTGALLKAKGSDLGTLRQEYFDAVTTYQGLLKEGKDGTAAARKTMEAAREAYQSSLSEAAGTDGK